MKGFRAKIFIVTVDLAIFIISFFLMLWAKKMSPDVYFPRQLPFYLVIISVWMLISMVYGKLMLKKIVNLRSLLVRTLGCNFIIVSTITLLMYVFRDYTYSRIMVLGTAMLATVFELGIGMIWLAYKKAEDQNYEDLFTITGQRTAPDEFELVTSRNGNGNGKVRTDEINNEIIRALEHEVGKELTQEIIRITGENMTDNTAVLSTTTVFNITSLPRRRYDYIINLHRINDIVRPDEFFDAVNAKLGDKGYMFCCCETKDQRKKRILRKFPPVINWIWYSLDFVVKRILPKMKMTYGIYYFLTRGRNAVISRAEFLGRLSRAGFGIMQESFIGNLLCVEAVKLCDPLPVSENIASPFIALPRIGKEGKIIRVYKLRTMHPYSQYIQNYVYDLYDLQDGGKFKNDFRITTWGAICRKIWLDELPMLINILKGEMKFFGVRPLSRQYFDLYDEDVRKRRINYKPGLIPPYYVDMPADLKAIQASEIKYLDSYDRSPFLTDFTYFWRSWYNILFRNARSK